MGASELTGTPWHVEKIFRTEGDPRRHRSWCAHYRKKGEKCVHYNEHCGGATYCPAYVRRDNEGNDISPRVCKQDKPVKKKQGKEAIVIGDRIKHVSYGEGVVKEVSGDKAQIVFANGKEMVFGIAYCLENGIINTT